MSSGNVKFFLMYIDIIIFHNSSNNLVELPCSHNSNISFTTFTSIGFTSKWPVFKHEKGPPFCDKRTFKVLYKIKTHELLSS